MAKPLTQITFEFSGAEAAIADMPVEEKVVEAPVKKKLVPPVVVKKTGSGRGRRSLKDISLTADLVQIPEDEILFQKQYYSIGEVAGMFKENTSLIRYWENEFDILEPRKNRKGDRFFKPSDIKNLQLIHDLLRRRKFTIEGAKEFIKKNRQAREKYEMIQSLQKLKAFLLELKIGRAHV